MKARVSKLHAQYLCENTRWRDEVSAFMTTNKDTNVAGILHFVEHVCLPMENHFPINELMDWKLFETSVLSNTADFDRGKTVIMKLVERYHHLFQDSAESTKLMMS